MDTDNIQHKVFQNDPLKLKEFVNKYVEVRQTSGKTTQGTVFTIDPVSESILLMSIIQEKLTAELIVGHAVADIQMTDEPPGYQAPDQSVFAQKNVGLSPKALEKRKLRVKAWLNENRLPITESGELLTMENAVTIHPPYDTDNVFSHNEMVLERVQKLIKSMPPST